MRLITPVMKKYNVPGMAVAVSVKGDAHFYQAGVASKATGQRVTKNTLFEIGSLSKTFSAILASMHRLTANLISPIRPVTICLNLQAAPWIA